MWLRFSSASRRSLSTATRESLTSPRLGPSRSPGPSISSGLRSKKCVAGSASLTKAFVPSSCPGGSARGKRSLRKQVSGQSPGQASGVALAVAPAAAEAVKDGGGGGASNNVEGTKIGAAAAVGAVVGFAGGLVWGTKNTVQEVRAKKHLEERLGQLTAAGSRSLGTPGETTPILEWLHVLTKELAEPGG